MNKKFILFSGVVLLLIAACGKSPCGRSIGLRYAFAGFTMNETDTVLVKKYVKGSNFNTIIDSVSVDTLLLKFMNRNDTLFPSMLHVQTLLSSLYDYQLSIPAVNRTFRITEIIEEEKTWKHAVFSPPNDCINPITAYTLDGLPVQVAPFHEVIYLKK